MIGHAVARVLGILVGHLYPLYRTFKVCSIPEGETSIDSQRLVHVRRILAFWAVHGAFTFAEYFVDFFVFWFPLYYEAKVVAMPFSPRLLHSAEFCFVVPSTANSIARLLVLTRGVHLTRYL